MDIEEMLDELVSLARASQAADIDANLCGMSCDFRQAERVQEAFENAREEFLRSIVK